MTRLNGRLLAAATFALGTMIYAAPAQAQATRTYVSGVGDDANPCSRTAPCRTWAGAISKTAAGGEMDCLDPGGFGAVTITKSMTIFCPYSDGGILVAGQNAININDSGAGNIHVVIDGLNLEGLGNSTTSPGIRGINFISGASLLVRNTIIRGFRDPSNGTGISFTPSTSARLTVENTTITRSGNAGAGAGILVQPTGAGIVGVTIENVRVIDGSNVGIQITPGAANVLANINNSTIASNMGTGLLVTTTSANTQGRVFVNNTHIVYNAPYGVRVEGGNLAVGLANTAVTGNATGLSTASVSPGLGILTYKNNRVNGNQVEGAFSGQLPEQ